MGLRAVAKSLPKGLGYTLFSGLFVFFGWLLFPIRSKINRRLRLSFPDASNAQLAKIRRAFWVNFGKTNYEILSQDNFGADSHERVEVQGLAHVSEAREAGRAIVFVHAHQANWEVLLHFCEWAAQHPICGIYSPLAVPQLHRLSLFRRTRTGTRIYPRSFKGSVAAALKDLSKGYPMIVALDQRINGGIPVPFFGKDAMTAYVPVKMAQRMDAHLIPIDLERLPGHGRFKITFHPNLLPEENPKEVDPADILMRYNALLESWIKDRPQDWFWLHNRWG